nr:hypothetical protein CFP56_72621 [Quercus suber]
MTRNSTAMCSASRLTGAETRREASIRAQCCFHVVSLTTHLHPCSILTVRRRTRPCDIPRCRHPYQPNEADDCSFRAKRAQSQHHATALTTFVSLESLERKADCRDGGGAMDGFDLCTSPAELITFRPVTRSTCVRGQLSAVVDAS